MLDSLAGRSLYQAFIQTLDRRVASSVDESVGETVDFRINLTEPVPTKELEEIFEIFYGEDGYSIQAGAGRSLHLHKGGKLAASVTLTNTDETVMVTVNPF